MPVTLNAAPRSTFGKNAARRLRREGRVPAVVYGHGEENRPIEIAANELERLLSSISVENTIIDLTLDGGAARPALIREVQHHPVRPEVLHVDLLLVHAGEKLHLQVPLRFRGSPVGVRENAGIFQEVVRELDIECLPQDIPEYVEVNTDSLDIGDTIHIRDLTVPNVKVLNDPDVVVCTVSAPTVVELPEAPETEEGIGGDVEPELIRDRKEDAEDTDFEHGSRQPE